jgi:hypothetical protein
LNNSTNADFIISKATLTSPFIFDTFFAIMVIALSSSKLKNMLFIAGSPYFMRSGKLPNFKLIFSSIIEVIYSSLYGSNRSCASLIARADCFFLNGKSTELAIPIKIVLVFDANIVLVNVLKLYSCA